jgi:hypothetical protein
MSKKNRDKIRGKKEKKRKTIKNQIKKRRKGNITLSKNGWKNYKKVIRQEEPKISVLTHELLASSLS